MSLPAAGAYGIINPGEEGRDRLITAVVSVYNCGQYLPKCMDSLLAQTCRDYEIILVDDGSTDGSSAVCDQQAARSEKIRVFHKPNGGLSSARNLGIEKAKGDFIIFPDPDDWVEPDYLQSLLDIRERHGADLSVCGHYTYGQGRDTLWNPGAREIQMGQEEALVQLMKPASFCGYAWNKLFSMDVIRENGLRFDEELLMVQDLHFAYRYFQFCRVIAYDPRPLYHYNRDTGGVTASRSPLTKRKLNGLSTYVKIAELAHQPHPNIEKMAYSTISDTCLDYIFLYFRTHMHAPETLDMLKNTFVKYSDYFYASREYTERRKKMARLIPAHPRLYYGMVSIKRVTANSFADLKKRIGKR